MRTTAILLPCLLGVLAGPLAGQIRVGQRLPDGQTVTVDPSVPPSAPSGEELRDRCRARIDDARRALKADRLHDARRRATSAWRYAATPALREEVRELLRRLETQGQQILDEADRLWDSRRYDKARTAYQRVVYCMGDLPSGRAARRELDAIEDDPGLHAHRRETTARRMERGLLAVLDAHAPPADANVLLPPGPDAPDPTADPTPAQRDADANRPQAEDLDANRPAPPRSHRITMLSIERQERLLRTLERLAESFPDTSPGTRAARDLAVLRETPGFVVRIEGYRQVRRLRREMQLIRNYHRAGRLDKALPRARKLVREHPDSPVAAEARAWIDSVTSAP